MSFKEKLNRYKQGTATPDEKKFIEKELEKYGLIEEYYSDDLFDEFLEKESFDDVDVPDEDTTNIQKIVNKRLRNVVLTSVMIVVVLYIVVFYGVSGIVNKMYYDPATITQPVEDELPQRSDFHYDLTAYIELNMPGFAIGSQTHEKAEGFGNHELGYSLNNLFTNEQQFHFMNISRNKRTFANEGIFNHPNRIGSLPGFNKIYSPIPNEEGESEDSTEMIENEITRKNEITLDYLDELNDLSYISMNIAFDEDLTMEEFHTLKEEHPELDFKWVGIRTTEPGTRWKEGESMQLIGFNPNFSDEPSSMSRPDSEKYPYFYLNDVMRPEENAIPEGVFPNYYEKHFKSRLNYIHDQKDFVKLFDSYPNKVAFYEEAIDYVEEKGVKTYGVQVYGTSAEFLEAMDDLPYESLYISDILPTEPLIY